MFQTLVKIAAFLSLICLAQAGGSVSYRLEVAPLVAARPDLAPGLSGIQVADTGDGMRISYIMCPGLAGHRVGPYEFSAVEQKSGRTVSLKFRTRQRFVNAYGVVVAEFYDGEQTAGGDIANAVKVQEELIAISVARVR